MRSVRSVACAVSLVLVLSSCGGDSGEMRVIPEDRLDAALLTIDDFEAGWNEDQRAVFTSRTEGPQAFESTGWCPRADSEVRGLENLDGLAGDTGAAVEFGHERPTGRRMFQGVSQQVWSNENVSKYFDLVSDVLETCSGETWSPETDQEVTVSDFETLDLGDDSSTVNITIATPGPDGTYLWSSRLVIVVIDSTIMILRDLDVQAEGGEPLMSDDEWNGLVDAAMMHFTDVVGTTSAKGGILGSDPFFADVSPAVPVG